MATKHTDEIHKLTSAEINRQIRMHTERRSQIVNERAAMYGAALKNGGSVESPVVDADERAAREHAKTLLNGSAPASLLLPPDISRDKILYREQRGIDIALKILTDKDLVARAADAVAWAEANGDKWLALCRETVLTVIKLEALEDRARQLLGECGDVFSVRLPMANVVGGRSITETPISELTETALADGIVTNAEIRKAQNVT